ncbi:uncharacterized protein LOC119700918 [Motacilla alba alba]|uniref:uncharacterized protein LOC119700918 n=1 Tax=Motacilla alba alba TaxID=1094192 RepID=UPI0018D54868|nr:uncharacterized protein LOC119700918 [Motacilla alba alba]
MAAPPTAGALPPPPAPSLPQAADTGSRDRRRRRHRARPGLPGLRSEGRDRAQGRRVSRASSSCSSSPPPCYTDIERDDRGSHRPAATSASRGRIQDPATAPRRWHLLRAAGNLPLGRAADGSLPPAPPSSGSAAAAPWSLLSFLPPPPVPGGGDRQHFFFPLPHLPLREEWRGRVLAPRLGPWPGAGSIPCRLVRLVNGRFWSGITAVLSSPSDLPLQRNIPPSVSWLKGADDPNDNATVHLGCFLKTNNIPVHSSGHHLVHKVIQEAAKGFSVMWTNSQTNCLPTYKDKNDLDSFHPQEQHPPVQQEK